MVKGNSGKVCNFLPGTWRWQHSILFLSVALKPRTRTFLEKMLNLITFLTGGEYAFVCGIHPHIAKCMEHD